MHGFILSICSPGERLKTNILKLIGYMQALFVNSKLFFTNNEGLVAGHF